MPTRANSDESYVLDLCDDVLGVRGSRQHRFDWLLGDPGAHGRRVRLPVDAYWQEHALVVEYRERQHDVAVRHFDKPHRLTVSGVHRGEQRRLYDQRRERTIPEQGLRLLAITPADLQSDARGRLRRDRDRDLPVVRRLLGPPKGWSRQPPSSSGASTSRGPVDAAGRLRLADHGDGAQDPRSAGQRCPHDRWRRQ